MFARFDENPAVTLRVIKETKRYGRTDTQTDGRRDNVKTVYPLQTKFAGGIINTCFSGLFLEIRCGRHVFIFISQKTDEATFLFFISSKTNDAPFFGSF